MLLNSNYSRLQNNAYSLKSNSRSAKAQEPSFKALYFNIKDLHPLTQEFCGEKLNELKPYLAKIGQHLDVIVTDSCTLPYCIQVLLKPEGAVKKLNIKPDELKNEIDWMKSIKHAVGRLVNPLDPNSQIIEEIMDSIKKWKIT